MVRVLWAFAFCTAASAAGTHDRAKVWPSLRRHQTELQQPEDDTVDIVASSPVETNSATPLVIPAPANVGPDGFPQLPAVTAMLGSATGTMRTINTEATALEEQVVRVEESNAAKMTQQKSIFEHKLHQQEAKNRAILMQNGEISEEITTLKKENLEFRRHAKQISETNHLMRTELRTLQSKFGDSKEFITDSLKETDDSKAKELFVLKSSIHHKQVEADAEMAKAAAKSKDNDDDDDDDDKDDDDDGEKGESFLALSSKVRRVSMETEESAEDTEQPLTTPPPADPKDLVEVLRSGVTELAVEERNSEKRLKAIFVSSYQEGTRRHQALLAQQKSFNETRTSLTELQQQLRKADKHLENSQANLQQRLRGIGLFVQRLAHLALAPTGEVHHLIEALPSSVTPAAVPDEK